MPGVDAPAASRANRKQHTSRVTTVTPVHPAFPARWFYGFLRALLGDRAFLSPSSARCEASSPTWRQRRGVRTTRLRRPLPGTLRHWSAKAAIASRLTSVTIAKRPSAGAGRRRSV